MPGKIMEAPILMPTVGADDTITVDVVQHPVQESKPGRVIAIVGFAETSRDQVHSEPKTTEVWSLNRCNTFLKNWDVWFELHEEDLYSGKTGLREATYMDLLKKSTVPIYMQHPNPEFPMARQFPKNEIVDMFDIDYFTTSIAYMIALVAYQHKLGDTVSEMHMYGVDMSAFTEYSEQLPCVNYWLGILTGLGIKVVIPSVSPLLKCAMQYGRHGERPLQKMAKQRLASHKEKQAQLTTDGAAVLGASAEYSNLFKSLDELIGAVEKAEIAPLDLVKMFKDACKNRQKEINQYHAQLNADLNATLGGLREAQHWIVALNAAQTMDEEPEPAKLPKI
jgi:hypothetical protein